MSFGSGGGGGGFSFGSNNNNNQGGGFGGFGSSTNNNTGGFGANASNTGGFGSSTPAPNPFGGSTFGSNTNTGGFGGSNSNTGSLFGNKPASNPFSASTTTNTSGGLFGGSTSNTGTFGSATGGGFGSSTTNNAFGGNNNTASSGFSFGAASKPAFGNTTNSTPLFGQGGSGTTGGFGSSSSPFGGAGSGTALSNQPLPPSEGTAVTPYVPTLEKEASGPSSNYQSINFMPAYQKYSFEELRIADYNAGRRFGNSTGQAGGFGSSTNTFGGFGSTNAGGFANNATSNPFGSTTTSSSGFGANTSTAGFGGGGGGGLFGAKPATGGLFNSTSTAAPAPSGGLFGSSTANTNNAFGTGTNTGFGTSGGLFGGQTQNQAKPGGLFGNSSAATGSAFSFGNNNATTNAGGGLFGNTNTSNTGTLGAAPQASGGLFGNNNSQQQKPSLFGNTTGGFGAATNQTQPTGGLFGNTSTNTGGGLFGNTSNANTGTGAFGNSSNAGTGLFGNSTSNQQQKPGGLFGGSTGSGGLFGNNNSTQQPGGLFGSQNNNTNTGGGFSFGNKPATTSLFGNNNQQPTSLGASLFAPGPQGTQQMQPNQSMQSDFKVSSFNDPNPYGQTSIWTGLPIPTPDNSKPLFTPLSATQKMKESQSKPPPSLRLNQSRYQTPPRRSGFGFSYSTYGTPSSAASTPGGSGLDGSMYGRSFNAGSIGRSFGKSASVSNLRSHFAADASGVLSPDSFASTNTRWSSGNMRRLTIDRSIRNDLFSRPSLPALPSNTSNQSFASNDKPASDSSSGPEPGYKLKKRVSFDKDTMNAQNGAPTGTTGGSGRGEDNAEEDDRSRTANGSATPETEPVRGNELAVVPEDRESDDTSPRKAIVEDRPDPQPGDYWMKPTRGELSKMSRDKLVRLRGFEVGRQGCGKVIFDDPVDLTNIPLDDLYEKIVEIRVRAVTVYPEASSKPPRGKGLNVPSTIFIENSWPRNRGQPCSATSGAVFDKHVNRLKRIGNTEFVRYESDTGVWVFRVPHYTRYGLDYDDEDEDDDELGQSQLTAPPDSFLESQSGEDSRMDMDHGEQDEYETDEDDTFAFKQKTLPGGFGRRSAIDYNMDASTTEQLGDGSFHADEDDESDDDEPTNEMSMVGSYPPTSVSPTKPLPKASIMGTPGKALINIDGDWAEQLQRTISPRKQNRDALREVQSKVLLDHAYEPMKPKSAVSKNVNKRDFRTSIDIMHSLFDKHEARMADLKGKKGNSQVGMDFEFPYAKRPKTFDDQVQADAIELSENDKLWHSSFKPHFTPLNKLVHKSNDLTHTQGWVSEVLARSESTGPDVIADSLDGVQNDPDVQALLRNCRVILEDEIPMVKHDAVPFSQVKDSLAGGNTAIDELDAYELLHVLFDQYEDEFTTGLSRQQQQEYQARIRIDRLSKFIADLVWRRHNTRIKAASKVNAPTAAIMHLTANNIRAACEVLMEEKDFHLSLLVAQIEQGDAASQENVSRQISDWRSQDVISEMSEEIRALYEILSGNTSIVQGKQNVPVENRASTFAISERFELDWVQAFGLCLWYGKHKNGDIKEIVADFQSKLESNFESATPIGSNDYEDPLWVVLKIFASSGGGKTKGSRATTGTQVEEPVLPQAFASLSQPFYSQKAFYMHHVVSAALQGLAIDQDVADKLASSLAFEESARGHVVGAVYALLHIKNSTSRAQLIQELLDHYAAALPTSDSNVPQIAALWTALTSDLRLPLTWIYQSKALLAHSCNEPLEELHYLVLAKDYARAHTCLLRRVAPRLVIDQDWESLNNVLSSFGESGEKTVDAALLADTDYVGTEWKNGGQIYADFVELMAITEPSAFGRRGSSRDDNEARQTMIVLERLQESLSRLETQNTANADASTTAKSDLYKDREKLEERVALREMGKVVARVIEKEDGFVDKKSILDLPLTAEARMSHSRNLGMTYYRGVMAMAH